MQAPFVVVEATPHDSYASLAESLIHWQPHGAILVGYSDALHYESISLIVVHFHAFNVNPPVINNQ